MLAGGILPGLGWGRIGLGQDGDGLLEALFELLHGGDESPASGEFVNGGKSVAERSVCLLIPAGGHEDFTSSGQPGFLAWGLAGELAEAGEGGVELFLFDLEVDGIELEGDQGAELADAFFEALERGGEVVGAGGGQGFGSFDEEFRCWVGGMFDGGGEVLGGEEVVAPFGQGAGAGGEGLGMVGVVFEEPAEGGLGGDGPVGFQEKAAPEEVDFGEGGVEFQGAVVVGLGGIPVLVGAVEFGAMEVELCIGGVLVDLAGEVFYLLVEISVGPGQAGGQEGESED